MRYLVEIKNKTIPPVWVEDRGFQSNNYFCEELDCWFEAWEIKIIYEQEDE